MSLKKLGLASPWIQQIEIHTYVKMWNLSSVCVYFMAIATSATVKLFAYCKVLEQRRPLTVICCTCTDSRVEQSLSVS